MGTVSWVRAGALLLALVLVFGLASPAAAQPRLDPPASAPGGPPPLDGQRFILTVTGNLLVGSVTLEILDPNRLRNSQDNYVSVRIGR